MFLKPFDKIRVCPFVYETFMGHQSERAARIFSLFSESDRKVYENHDIVCG